MKKKLNPIVIISVVTGILLAVLVGILVFFNLPAQRIRRMLKTANKYIAEENYEEAILTLQKIMEIDPKNEDLYILLADTYEKSGDIDKEVEILREAVALMPENSKISEVLLDVYPDVTLSENSGTYSDPVSLSMSSPEGSEIFYKVSGSNKESKYSSPIDFGKNGEYTIEYYAVSKSGYEGEHKTATYVIKLDESKYHFNEWVDEADGKHYYDADGVSVTGWQQLGGLWYLFDKTGVMLTGLQDDKGKTYYLGTDGIMLTGWQEINGKKYYFDESGAMLKNQWIDDTYYVGADGAMLVDTKTPDGKKVGKDGKKIDEAWKQVYINYINNDLRTEDNYENFQYNLIYVDNDDIPEIVVNPHSSYSITFILKIFNGEVKMIGGENLEYKEKSGLISCNSMAMSADEFIYEVGSEDFDLVACTHTHFEDNDNIYTEYNGAWGTSYDSTEYDSMYGFNDSQVSKWIYVGDETDSINNSRDEIIKMILNK